MKKTWLKVSVIFFSADFNPIDTNDILGKNIMFVIIEKIIIVLLGSIVTGSYHTKCIWLSNQKGMIQPNLINLYSNNKYSQNFH